MSPMTINESNLKMRQINEILSNEVEIKVNDLEGFESIRDKPKFVKDLAKMMPLSSNLQMRKKAYDLQTQGQKIDIFATGNTEYPISPDTIKGSVYQ